MSVEHDERRTVIRARGLRKNYGEVAAVDGIDFEVAAGEAFGLLGPNGAGKSSIMRMIGGVSRRSGGELSVLGLDPDVDGPAVRSGLGVIPQDDTLDAELTVRDNLRVYGRYFGLSRAECRERAERLLEFAQLTDKASAKVEEVSGGMRRRLTIARALISDPYVLLLDEPTTGLDPQARNLLWDRLFQLKEDGTTLVLTTHYMDEAEQLCDRIAVVDHGRIMAEGSPSELIRHYTSREVVELRFGRDRNAEHARMLADLGVRVDVLTDRVVIYTDDGEGALNEVARRELLPLTSLVRRASLEDVFLHLTGRSLIE